MLSPKVNFDTIQTQSTFNYLQIIFTNLKNDFTLNFIYLY